MIPTTKIETKLRPKLKEVSFSSLQASILCCFLTVILTAVGRICDERQISLLSAFEPLYLLPPLLMIRKTKSHGEKLPVRKKERIPCLCHQDS